MRNDILQAIHFAVAHRDEIVQSMQDAIQEDPKITNGTLALGLAETYPELARDQILDLIQLERPALERNPLS